MAEVDKSHDLWVLALTLAIYRFHISCAQIVGEGFGEPVVVLLNVLGRWIVNEA